MTYEGEDTGFRSLDMKKTLAVLGIAILVIVADLLLAMGRHVGVAPSQSRATTRHSPEA